MKASLYAALASLGLALHGQAWAAESASLEEQVKTLNARLQQLEVQQGEMAEALNEPYISAQEPEMAARLKAVESQANRQKKAALLGDSLEGIAVGAGLTMVAQDVVSGATKQSGQLNYRADVEISVPMDTLGNSTESELYGQFRIGQGEGVGAPDRAFTSANATTFQRPGTDASDSTVLLAQAWYGLKLPLPIGGNPGLSRERLELNVGKIDPFVFFDGNAVSDDETASFMNQALVHNPLLDVGGDIGVDDFGFTPGLRLAYVNERAAPESFTLSMGVFGAGKGASFTDSLDAPMVMVQAETEQRLLQGMVGRYRLYAWNNERGENVDGGKARHIGVGLSLDQQVHDYTRIFARLGQQLEGKVRVDQTATLGVELGGSYWNRGADALGLACGLLQVSDDFKGVVNLDLDDDGVIDLSYNARGSEQITELFYRYFVNSQVTLTPSLQYANHLGGDSGEDSTVVGLRTQINY
ncbi:MAG: Carbohydrate-selective porin [Pseudomonadota bacterium]|jgi:hypothetical protein